MQRTSVGGTVSYTVYAFGLEEHQYNSSGTNTGNTSYYSVGGQLIGEQAGTSTKSTTFLLTDLLGSVLASFSNTPNSAAVQGNQVYAPYGSSLYQQGSIGTSKGFTGQYTDSTSGLNYDNARYYDPVVGQFITADDVQGNMQGMDPYAYVSGNPETWIDPSGHDGGEEGPLEGGAFGPWGDGTWNMYQSPNGVEGPEDLPIDVEAPTQFAAESFNEEYSQIGAQEEEQQNILNAENQAVIEEQDAAMQELQASMGELPGEGNGITADTGGGATDNAGVSADTNNAGSDSNDPNSSSEEDNPDRIKISRSPTEDIIIPTSSKSRLLRI